MAQAKKSRAKKPVRKAVKAKPIVKAATIKTLSTKAIESNRAQAEKVVHISSDTMKQMLSSGAGEAQRMQEKFMSFGRDGAQQLTKGADAATKMMYEVANIYRDNVQAAMESGNLTSEFSKEFGSEIYDMVSNAFSDSIEVYKEAFACRNINDMMELQTRLSRSVFENIFEQSSRLSDMVFEYAAEAYEPVNQRLSEASHQISKVLKVA